MIYTEIFRLFFTVAVFWLDLAKGEPILCTIKRPIGKSWLQLPLAFTIDVLGKARIIYPDKGGNFTVDSNTWIVFACIKFGFISNQFSKKQEVKVRCSRGTKYRYKGQNVDFSEFMCKDLIPTEAKMSERGCQPNNNTVYDVGYKTSGYFFTLYSVCFDENNLNTLYSWYQVRYPFIDHFQDQERTAFFQEDIYGNLKLDSIYSRSTQRFTINQILKIHPKSKKCIKDEDIFLSKGHLSSKTDFYFAREQISTFNYLNIFPQWYKSNKMWTEIEMMVRRELGKNRYNRRVVVTGVYGSFTLPDNNNNEQPLYLVMPTKKVAVPKFHWKMIFDADDENNNIVYISFNNPTSKPQEGVQRDLNCTLVRCPGSIKNRTTEKWMKARIMFCCTIAAFQVAYGVFNSDVFSVPEKIMPGPAA